MIESDAQLLARFARDDAEDAFRELVGRHVNLVYSTALRTLAGDAALAEDVTQTVFRDLALGASRLGRTTVLSGWLYQATRFAAAKLVRSEQRRRARETTAWEAQMNQPEPEPDWEQIRPLLDEAMDTLPTADRDAVLLRYFDRRELAAVGASLGLSDEAARKRISRALERMRTHLARRGIRTSTGALGTIMTVHAVHAAPAGLAASVASASLVAGAGVGVASVSLLSSLKFLPTIAMTKTQAVVTAALIAAGVATPLLWQHHQLDALRSENAALRGQLELAPPTVVTDRILGPVKAEPATGPAELDELLKLRGEVAQLRRDNASLSRQQVTQPNKTRSGRRIKPAVPPSSQPGYVSANQYAFAGFANPQATMQSYFWAMENPGGGRLMDALALPEHVRKLLPKDQPADLTLSGDSAIKSGVEIAAGSPDGEKVITKLAEDGQPLGLTKGYRITGETDLPDGRKQVEVERELPDGTVRTESHTLVQQGDEWKIQPDAGMKITAVKSGGTGEDPSSAANQHVEVRFEADDAAPAP